MIQITNIKTTPNHKKATIKTCDTHLRMTLLFLNHAILYYSDELEHHLS